MGHHRQLFAWQVHGLPQIYDRKFGILKKRTFLWPGFFLHFFGGLFLDVYRPCEEMHVTFSARVRGCMVAIRDVLFSVNTGQGQKSILLFHF